MSLKLSLLTILLVCTLTGLVYIQREYGGSLHEKPSSQPNPTPSSTTILSFAPSEIVGSPGIVTKADIILESVGTSPSVVQLEMAYDPLSIADIQIIPGDYFSNPEVLLSTINPNIGRISYALQTNGNTTAKDKKAILATIYFTPLVGILQKDSSFYFLPKTSIKTVDGKNVFTAGYGIRIVKPTYATPIASAAAY